MSVRSLPKDIGALLVDEQEDGVFVRRVLNNYLGNHGIDGEINSSVYLGLSPRHIDVGRIRSEILETFESQGLVPLVRTGILVRDNKYFFQAFFEKVVPLEKQEELGNAFVKNPHVNRFKFLDYCQE